MVPTRGAPARRHAQPVHPHDAARARDAASQPDTTRQPDATHCTPRGHAPRTSHPNAPSDDHVASDATSIHVRTRCSDHPDYRAAPWG